MAVKQKGQGKERCKGAAIADLVDSGIFWNLQLAFSRLGGLCHASLIRVRVQFPADSADGENAPLPRALEIPTQRLAPPRAIASVGPCCFNILPSPNPSTSIPAFPTPSNLAISTPDTEADELFKRPPRPRPRRPPRRRPKHKKTFRDTNPSSHHSHGRGQPHRVAQRL